MTHPARAKWGAKTWISWWHEESRHQRWRNNLVVGSQSPSSLIHLQLPVSICLAWGRVINHWEYSFYPSPIIHVIFIFLSRPVSAHWRGRAGPWLPNVKISCQGSTWIWFMYYHTNSLSSPHCPAPPHRSPLRPSLDKMSVSFPEFQLSYHTLNQTNSLFRP